MKASSSVNVLIASTALFIGSVSATIFTTSPVATTTCSGGAACRITWESDSNTPDIATFGQVNIGLFTGNQIQQTQLIDFGVFNPVTVKTISPVIPAATGPNSGFYFIRFTSVNAKDASNFPLEAFSARFTMDRMTGQFSAAAQAQNSAVTSAIASPTAASGTASLASMASIVANATSISATSSVTCITCPSSSSSASGKSSASASAATNLASSKSAAVANRVGGTEGAVLGGLAAVVVGLVFGA